MSQVSFDGAINVAPIIQESYFLGAGFTINVDSFLSLISKIAEFFAWLFDFSSKATMADLKQHELEVLKPKQVASIPLPPVSQVTSYECVVFSPQIMPANEQPVVDEPAAESSQEKSITEEEQQLIKDLEKELTNGNILRGLAWLKIAIGINKQYTSLRAIARSYYEKLKPGAIKEVQDLMSAADQLIAKETLSSDDIEKAKELVTDLELYKSHIFVEGSKECIANLEAKLDAIAAKKQEALKAEENEPILLTAEEFMNNPMKLDFGVLSITIDIIRKLEIAESNAQGELKEKIANAKQALLNELEREFQASADSMWEEACLNIVEKYPSLKEFNELMKKHQKHHLKHVN